MKAPCRKEGWIGVVWCVLRGMVFTEPLDPASRKLQHQHLEHPGGGRGAQYGPVHAGG